MKLRFNSDYILLKKEKKKAQSGNSSYLYFYLYTKIWAFFQMMNAHLPWSVYMHAYFYLSAHIVNGR